MESTWGSQRVVHYQGKESIQNCNSSWYGKGQCEPNFYQSLLFQISTLQKTTDFQCTWSLVVSEVDVGQNKVDDSRAIRVHIRILGFKDVALL